MVKVQKDIPLLRYVMWTVILALVYLDVFANRGLLDWRRMVRENNQLSLRIDEARREKLALEQDLRALQKDPLVRDSLVRKNLGYLREDEFVVDFD